MRQRSPEFWARVRTVNWILGGVGLFFSLFYALSNQQERVQMPDRTISRLVFSPDGRTLVGYGSWIEPGVRLGETRAWDVRTGKRLWSESHAVSDVLPGTFLPDGSSLVTVRAAYHAFRSDKHQEYRPGYDVFLRLTFRDARTGRTSPQEAVFLGSPRSARFKH
ncbi:MAG: WD40 repeat domain-containing protein, partial [Armatimonadota bacterium]